MWQPVWRGCGRREPGLASDHRCGWTDGASRGRSQRLDPVVLREAGLSGAKVLSVLDLTARCVDGRLELDRLGRMSDAGVVDTLSSVRGIGPWSAQMFLMHELGRLDVWPTGDLGVRAGYARAFSLRSVPTPGRLEELGERFRPYRSVAAWYCWRAADDPE